MEWGACGLSRAGVARCVRWYHVESYPVERGVGARGSMYYVLLRSTAIERLGCMGACDSASAVATYITIERVTTRERVIQPSAMAQNWHHSYAYRHYDACAYIPCACGTSPLGTPSNPSPTCTHSHHHPRLYARMNTHISHAHVHMYMKYVHKRTVHTHSDLGTT